MIAVHQNVCLEMYGVKADSLKCTHVYSLGQISPKRTQLHTFVFIYVRTKDVDRLLTDFCFGCPGAGAQHSEFWKKMKFQFTTLRRSTHKHSVY